MEDELCSFAEKIGRITGTWLALREEAQSRAEAMIDFTLRKARFFDRFGDRLNDRQQHEVLRQSVSLW